MDALIAVLAGGRGTRLGGTKATAELAGRPLIEHAMAAASEAAELTSAAPSGSSFGGDARLVAGAIDVLVVAKPDSPLPELDVPILREPERPSHPLCGVAAALREADGRAVVVMACDMPFVSPSLLAWLAGVADPLVVPEHGGLLHPLLARYEPALLPRLEAALAAEMPLQHTVASLGPRVIGSDQLARFGDPERLLFNVNTPADLERAERLLGG